MNIPNISSSSALSTLKAHRNVLEGLLPSQEATQLQRNLGPRLRDLARVMTSPYATLDPAHPRERDFQRLLWLQANTSGLIVLLLNATVRSVALDDEGSTAVALVTCINLILASGIQNRRFRPGRGMEDVEIIKRVATVVVPTIKTAWTKLIESVHSIRPLLLESIDRIEALVEFVCNITEFVEGGKSEDSTGTEPVTGASDTLRSSMRESAALEELLLFFISLKEKSLQLPLIGRAIATFTSVFEGHRPPLAAPPPGVHNLAIVFERLLSTGGQFSVGVVDVAHYSSIVKMIGILLTRPEFGQCFLDDGRTNEGSVRLGRGVNEQLCWSICRVYWRWLTDENTQKASNTDVMKITIQALVVACHLASFDGVSSRLDILLPQGTFLPLLARAALSWQLLGDNVLGDANALEGYNWQSSARKNLFHAFPGRIAFLEPLLDNSVGFLEVIDALRTAKSLNPDITTDIPMSIWKDFCALGKVYEQEHREREIIQRKKQMGAQVGCRWTKCPMYGTGGLERRHLLVCARCQTAVYCGTFCQARDWDEQHKLVCQP